MIKCLQTQSLNIKTTFKILVKSVSKSLKNILTPSANSQLKKNTTKLTRHSGYYNHDLQQVAFLSLGTVTIPICHETQAYPCK